MSGPNKEAKTMAIVHEDSLVILVIGHGDGMSERFVLRPTLRKKLLIELFRIIVGY